MGVFLHGFVFHIIFMPIIIEKSIYKDSQRKYLTTRGNIAVLPPLVSVCGVAPGSSWLPVRVSAEVATIP